MLQEVAEVAYRRIREKQEYCLGVQKSLIGVRLCSEFAAPKIFDDREKKSVGPQRQQCHSAPSFDHKMNTSKFLVRSKDIAVRALRLSRVDIFAFRQIQTISSSRPPRNSQVVCTRTVNGAFGNFRPFSDTASSQTTKLQELPDQRFWTEVFDELRSNYPAGTVEGAKVEKWLKLPRDSVKKGEFILDLDVAGAIISLRAESSGFVGSHMVKEGELLEKGMVATSILSEPEPLPSISESEMSKAMMDAQGSVSDLKDRLQDFEAQRTKVLDDLVAAYNLTTAQNLSETATDLIIARVPGQSNNAFAPVSGLFGPEISKEQLVEVELDSGIIKSVAGSKEKGKDISVDRDGIDLLGGFLFAQPSWSCALRITSPYLSALSAAPGASADKIRAAIGFPEPLAHDSGVSLADPKAESRRLLQLLGNGSILLLSDRRGTIVVGDSLVISARRLKPSLPPFASHTHPRSHVHSRRAYPPTCARTFARARARARTHAHTHTHRTVASS